MKFKKGNRTTATDISYLVESWDCFSTQAAASVTAGFRSPHRLFVATAITLFDLKTAAMATYKLRIIWVNFSVS